MGFTMKEYTSLQGLISEAEKESKGLRKTAMRNKRQEILSYYLTECIKNRIVQSTLLYMLTIITLSIATGIEFGINNSLWVIAAGFGFASLIRMLSSFD